MIKRFSFILVLLMFTTAAFSTVAISNKHKDGMKNNKKINCVFCHAGDMKIEKKKGQLVNNKILNGKALSKIKSCNGAGCHK